MKLDKCPAHTKDLTLLNLILAIDFLEVYQLVKLSGETKLRAISIELHPRNKISISNHFKISFLKNYLTIFVQILDFVFRFKKCKKKNIIIKYVIEM